MDDFSNEKIFSSEEEEADYYFKIISELVERGVTVVIPTIEGIMEIKSP